MLKSLNNTAFSEQKHRGVPTPIKRSRTPMPNRVTTFRVASCIQTINLTYNLRDSIYSSLMIYPLLRIFRLVCGFEKQPLLVTTLKPLSPKVSNQTNNGLENYNNKIYKCKNYFYCFIYIFIFILTTYNKGELKWVQ